MKILSAIGAAMSLVLMSPAFGAKAKAAGPGAGDRGKKTVRKASKSVRAMALGAGGKATVRIARGVEVRVRDGIRKVRTAKRVQQRRVRSGMPVYEFQ
jgi:hypothetical protein